MDWIAAHCDGYWSLASNTIRTARSITSGENFGDFLIMAPFSIEGASSNCGAVHITGIGCVKAGYAQRMLILMDIETLMSSVEMGLMESADH
jgi:hypothetical protein